MVSIFWSAFLLGSLDPRSSKGFWQERKVCVKFIGFVHCCCFIGLHFNYKFINDFSLLKLCEGTSSITNENIWSWGGQSVQGRFVHSLGFNYSEKNAHLGGKHHEYQALHKSRQSMEGSEFEKIRIQDRWDCLTYFLFYGSIKKLELSPYMQFSNFFLLNVLTDSFLLFYSLTLLHPLKTFSSTKEQKDT